MFDTGLYGSQWFNNVHDFLKWCDCEIKSCRPTGIAPQSMYITSGQAGFDHKYPTFEDAYRAYYKHVEEVMNQ